MRGLAALPAAGGVGGHPRRDWLAARWQADGLVGLAHLHLAVPDPASLGSPAGEQVTTHPHPIGYPCSLVELFILL